MDLMLTEAQQMLKDAARDFMSHEAPKDAIVRWQKSDEGLPASVWQAAAELGWLGVLIPALYGGSDGTFTDAAVLFEELGRGPLPGAFFQSGVLGALTLVEGGSEAQKSTILPRVAEGRDILTLPITEPDNSWGPQGIQLRPERPSGKDGGYVLNGVKLFAPDAVAATHFLVPVRTGEATSEISLLIVDARTPGVSVRNLPGFISWQAEVRFDNVLVPPEALLGGRENDGWMTLERAMEKALPVLCAYRCRRLSGDLRDVGGVQPDADAVRRAYRALPAGAGPHHPAREPPGRCALDHLRGAVEVGRRPAGHPERASREGRGGRILR
jgi:alkylation response protein AidB-like acyl-CoA dehydrogenase